MEQELKQFRYRRNGVEGYLTCRSMFYFSQVLSYLFQINHSLKPAN